MKISDVPLDQVPKAFGKYPDLLDSLKPGKAKKLSFSDRHDALQARNSIYKLIIRRNDKDTFTVRLKDTDVYLFRNGVSG